MPYNRLLVLIVLAGCQPTYTSGKTQCSDKKECPSGFSCYDDGTNSIHYCFDTKQVVNKDAGALGTGGAGGVKTTVVGSGGNGGNKDAGVGTGGVGGIKTTVVGRGGTVGTDGGVGAGADAGVLRDARTVDVAPDGASRDAGTACTPACPTGQQCLSGQCCVPPAAGGACSAYPACGCLAGNVCYPSSTTHAMACFTSDNLAEGADCSDGSTCQAGFGCFGGLCKRYCATLSDCPSVGGVRSCDQTTWSSDNSNILGVMACERVCDPAHPQSPKAPLLACPKGFNCSSDASGLSYCFQASPLPAGSTCTVEGDCPAGSYCTTSGSCTRYCLANSDCSSGTTCQFTWSPAEYAGSTLVGYCK
jgi:hypothetical protein